MAHYTDLLSGVSWGRVSSLAYAFTATEPAYYTGAEAYDYSHGVRALGSVEQAAVAAALAQFARVIPVSFVPVASASLSALSFGVFAIDGAYNEIGHGYYPTFSSRYQTGTIYGDIWFDRADMDREPPVAGSFMYSAVLHEIGHAMGLGHPFDVDPGGEHDNFRYTIMAYNNTNDFAGYNLTLQQDDIRALQSLYGVNTTTTAGNDTYALSTQSFMTVYDAGGVDTLNVSALGGHNTLDLRAGQFSSVESIPMFAFERADGRNLFIMEGSVIENAVAGSGDDVLIANEANNILAGGRGDDRYVFMEQFGEDVVQDDGGVLEFAGLSSIHYSLTGDTLILQADGGQVSLANYQADAWRIQNDSGHVLTLVLLESGSDDPQGDEPEPELPPLPVEPVAPATPLSPYYYLLMEHRSHVALALSGQSAFMEGLLG